MHPAEQVHAGRGAPASMELQDQIEAIVRPWTRTKGKPPFSMAQMVVMCLLLNKPLDKSGILAWLVDRFGYLRKVAVTCLESHTYSSGTSCYNSPGVRGIHLEFPQAFYDFKAPLLSEQHESGEDVFTVAADEGQLYIKPVLARVSEAALRPFPFMRLPTELRLHIYTMVLCLPESGVQIYRWGRTSTTRINVWDREYSQPSIMSGANYANVANYRPLSAGPLQAHLALLLTSKQIHREAMPVFYSENNFVTGLGPYDISLEALAPSRAQHFRYLSIDWKPLGTVKYATACFKSMKAMQNLQKLDIYFDTGEWKREKKPYNTDGILVPAKLPGFAKLRDLYIDKQVTVYGDCDKLREALKTAEEEAKKVKERRVMKRKATGTGWGKGADGATKANKVKVFTSTKA